MIPQITTGKDPIHVLLVGNNPIDLSKIYDHLAHSKTGKFISDTIFDTRDLLKKVKSFHPQCIVIDDNMETTQLSGLLNLLSSKSETKHIPITIVQNSNKDDKPRDGADEFILKDSVTPESISKSITNSRRIHHFREYLRSSYDRRKNQLLGLR